MIVTLCAGKGSPGVTTVATAMAYAWDSTPILAEVDPSGCDLPYRIKAQTGQALSTAHGVMSLAAACRQDDSRPQLLAHAQAGAGEQPILVGPENWEQSTAIGRYWSSISDQLWTHQGNDIIVDAGRLISEKALASPILQRSHVVIVVARATTSGMFHLKSSLTAISKILNTPAAVRFPGSALDRMAVLPICDPGGRQDSAAALAETQDVIRLSTGLSTIPVLPPVPFDTAGAATFGGYGRKRLDRTKISKALRKSIAEIVTIAPVEDRLDSGMIPVGAD